MSDARSLRLRSPRRNWFSQVGGLTAALWGVAGAANSPRLAYANGSDEQEAGLNAEEQRIINGKIMQSVVHWCFSPMSVKTLATAAARMGIQSVELVDQKEWPILKKLGLSCAIAGSHGFAKGFAHREEHDECIEALKKSIPAAKEFGAPNVIAFSGFRRGIDQDEGFTNMVAGLKRIAGFAEQHGVTVCLEMLNSRVATEMKGHPDYFCDHIDTAVEIVKKVGSPRVKVLFDIYHVQIMDGDVISRIKQHHEAIGHYHTAGNPGRNDLDETQEINYPPIMKAILETGYTGYVGQEFIPKTADENGQLKSLAQAAVLCDIA